VDGPINLRRDTKTYGWTYKPSFDETLEHVDGPINLQETLKHVDGPINLQETLKHVDGPINL